MNIKQTSSTELLLGSAAEIAATPAQAAGRWHSALNSGESSLLELAKSLGGDFAVALANAESGCGFAAVDEFSIQTVCYRIHEGKLRFASRADELADPGHPIEPQSLFDYLYFHCIPSPRTVFKGIYRLPAGHVAWVSAGQLTVAPLRPVSFSPIPQRDANFEHLRQEFLDLLQQAVRRSLDGSVPASFLSGGTDSSTVAGMVSRIAGQPSHTYSIGFDAAGYDEMAYARLAAKHFGAQHHEYYVTPDDLVRSIAHVAQSYDQPFGNSSALPAYYCAKVAKEAGVSRMLAGDGGDELFGGNSRYAKQRVFGWYGLVPDALRSGVLEPVLMGTRLGTWPLLKKVHSYIEQAREPMPSRLQMYNLLLRLGVQDVLEPGFLQLVDEAGPAKLQDEVWHSAQASNELDRTLAYDWRFTLSESDLPKVRGTTSLAGVGVAFPMLDDDLVSFSKRLPPDYKLKGLKLRWFFKEALRGFLPDEILTKRKQGFGLPFGVWATRHPALLALATDSLNHLAGRGIVRPAFIQNLLGHRLQEHPGYYGEMVWILMMLEQWLQRVRPAGGRLF